jgi:hypothetical protein
LYGSSRLGIWQPNQRLTPPDGNPIDGKPDIGHKESWFDYQNNTKNHTKTRDQVIDDYNDPLNLQYEIPSNNRSNGGKMTPKPQKPTTSPPPPTNTTGNKKGV